MSSDIQVVRQAVVGYDQHGDSSYSDESFIKLLVSFRNGSLRLLKGAPLSIYFSVALHEVDDPPGATVPMISDDTGLSERQIKRSLPFLADHTHRFVQESGFEPRTGAKIYRVAAYAWFGKSGQPSRAHPQRYDKLSPRAPILSPHDNVALVVDVDQDIPLLAEILQQQKQQAEVHDILHACGIFGSPLTHLAHLVSVETAKAWQAWIAEPPRGLRNPAGVVVRALLDDPTALPPTPRAATRRFRIQGPLADRLREEGKLRSETGDTD